MFHGLEDFLRFWQGRVVLRVAQRHEESACEGQERPEVSECILASDVCIQTHLDPHLLFEGSQVLGVSCLIDGFAQLFILVLQFLLYGGESQVREEETLSDEVGLRQSPGVVGLVQTG